MLAVSADISVDADCRRLVKEAVKAFGQVDVLVNNAGVLDTGLATVDHFDDEEIRKVVSINQIGTMQCIRAAMTELKAGASIVNVASVAGVNGGGGAAYVSSKAAIIGITKHTALLLAGESIRCNAVCPGNIVTPMTMNMDQSKIDKRMIGAMSKHNDLTIRPCMPEDVANIIAFLASDASKALTGQIIVSDFRFVRTAKPPVFINRSSAFLHTLLPGPGADRQSPGRPRSARFRSRFSAASARRCP